MGMVLSTGARIVIRLLQANPCCAVRHLTDLRRLGISERQFEDVSSTGERTRTIAGLLFAELKKHYARCGASPIAFDLYEQPRPLPMSEWEGKGCKWLLKMAEGYEDDGDLEMLCERLKSEAIGEREYSITVSHAELLTVLDGWAEGRGDESRLDSIGGFVGEDKVVYRRAGWEERDYCFFEWRRAVLTRMHDAGGKGDDSDRRRFWEKLQMEGMVERTEEYEPLGMWTFRLTPSGWEAAADIRSTRGIDPHQNNEEVRSRS